MKRLRQILSFARPFRGLLITAIILTGLLTLIGMAPPLLMRRLLNDVARQGNWGIFPLTIGLLFGVPVFRALVNVANSITLNRISQGVIGRTRKRMFRHLMRLSMRFYDETPVGNINQRVVGDAASVSTVISGGLIALLTDIIAVGFAIVVMVRLSPKLSLLTLGLLPLYLLNYWFFSKRIQRATAVQRSNMDHISAMLQERLSAHELIQSYGQDKASSTHFSSQAKQVMDASIRGASYSITFNQLSAFINKIGNTLIYCAGCYFFVKDVMGYGDVVAFCAYATQILGPIVRFAGFGNQIVQAGVSIDRINEVLGREPAIKESPDASPIEELVGDIVVSGVAFQYGTEESVLEGVNLEIPAGTHIAIAGTSGAGRSTLALLLRRFYDPTEGKIEVDGRDIREYRLKDYRQALALVMPESALFDGTLRENLCYGKPDATEERMISVSKAVGIHPFIEGLAAGYDTRVGTGGLKLSTGVRQQIGIARALISDPLILIVDEATAAMDPVSAESVADAIGEAMRGRTCVMIVNRLLLGRSADQIVVMDEGSIVESGSHEELVAEPGSLYRTIYGLQYGQGALPLAGGG